MNNYSIDDSKEQIIWLWYPKDKLQIQIHLDTNTNFLCGQLLVCTGLNWLITK